MLPPEEDLSDRRPIWDALQTFWLDNDPNLDLKRVAELCANSKYSLAEIEAIYWNEVHPAIRSNLFSVAGAWAGFDLDWLAERILRVHRFGKRPPIRFLDPYSRFWWHQLSAEIRRLKMSSA